MESPSVVFPTLPTYIGSPSLMGVLSLVLTVLLPVCAALFMRVGWSAWSKGLVLLFFAAVKTFLEAWLVAVEAHGRFDFGTVAWTVLIQFVLAVVAYVGLLRGTSVQQSAIHGGPVNER